MYSRIINPSNQKSVRVNSVLGKRILRNYINMLVGGSDTDTPVEEEAGAAGPTSLSSPRSEVDGSDTAATPVEEDDGDEYDEDGTWRDPLENLIVAETDGTERRTLEDDELEYMEHGWK